MITLGLGPRCTSCDRQIALGTGKGEMARQMLDSLARTYPDSWEAEEALGYVYWYAGDRSESRLHFGRAVEKGLPHAKTILDYIGLLGETGVANATLVPLVEKALQFQPDNPQANLKLASLLVSVGEFARAIDRLGGLGSSHPKTGFRRFVCVRLPTSASANSIKQIKPPGRLDPSPGPMSKSRKWNFYSDHSLIVNWHPHARPCLHSSP